MVGGIGGDRKAEREGTRDGSEVIIEDWNDQGRESEHGWLIRDHHQREQE